MSASRLQHYIYKITNKTTGEYYIGKHTSLDWRTDDYMGSGYLLNKKMKAHPDHEWVKEVLLLLSSEEQAYEYEAVAVGDRYSTDPLCLNLAAGGAGGGLTKADIEEREQRMRDWLDGEKLPDLETICMSNDETRTRTKVRGNTNVTKDIIRTLINLGYYFGYVNAYKRLSLRDLGLSTFLTKDNIISSIASGVFPPDINNVSLTNDQLKVRTSVNKSKRAVLIINDLLSKGWIVDASKTYEYKRLTEISSLCKCSSDTHHERYLQGLPCLVTGVTMISPCRTKSIIVRCKKNESYPQRVKELYDLGWTFGSAVR